MKIWWKFTKKQKCLYVLIVQTIMVLNIMQTYINQNGIYIFYAVLKGFKATGVKCTRKKLEAIL